MPSQPRVACSDLDPTVLCWSDLDPHCPLLQMPLLPLVAPGRLLGPLQSRWVPTPQVDLRGHHRVRQGLVWAEL